MPDTNPAAAQTLKPVYDSNGQQVYVPTDPNASPTLKPMYDSRGRPVYVRNTDPAAAQTLMPVYDKKGRVKYVPASDQYRQPDNSFYAYIEAQIIARNAKTLAQPTLLVQEGETATIETGTDFVVNVERMKMVIPARRRTPTKRKRLVSRWKWMSTRLMTMDSSP